MDKMQSAASKSDNAEKAEQEFASSKNATLHRQANMKTMQNFLPIWLDDNSSENSTGHENTLIQLRHAVNTINIFTDSDECIKFIEDINDNKICLIVSSSLSQHIVPRVHNMSQVDSIFIYCNDTMCHNQWTEDWFKIKGIFTEISSICEALKQASQQCEQNAVPMSFIGTSGDLSKEDLDHLDCSFMYTQILKEILLTIKFDQKHIQELIGYCRNHFAENEDELNNIKTFEKEYRDKTPIWWYTYECFLYPMLNRALRTMNVDIIIKMGFFISDLHHHIKQLYSEQFNGHHSGETLTVYRGQGMSKIDFEQLTTTKGGLMSFNTFLSTSKNRKMALSFARRAVPNPDLVGILFVMVIDPSISTAPFASINGIGYFQKEDETLFSMHSVFRIRNIQSMSENNRLFQVDLTRTSDNDKDLCMLTDRIREETLGSTGWYQLGELLLKLRQSEKAQQVYEVLLDQATNEGQKGIIYDRLGRAKVYRGEYREAISLFEKALVIQEQSLPSTHPDLAMSYNDIGAAYYNIGEYSKVLLYYEKALKIRQQSLPPNHSDLSMSYFNIGLVQYNMGEYSKALSYYEKDLEINQKILPSNHPDLGMSYNIIGTIYENMGEYSKAITLYNKTLQIQHQSLPSNHPDLAASYNSIGFGYCKMGKYSNAITLCIKGLEIVEQSLSPNHPNMASYYDSIGCVYEKMGEYLKALSSHEKALEIKQRSLPLNYPDLGMAYRNIGRLYCNMGEYSKAYILCEKAIEILQQSLPSSHLDLASFYNDMGMVYYNMDEYLKALSSHEKALEIRQQLLPSNHPDLGMSYSNIGILYCNMGEYSRAFILCEKAIEILQQSLSSNHPDMAWSYNNFGVVWNNMGEYSKARSYYERAVDIAQHSLPLTHPHLQWYRRNLDLIKRKL